MQYLFREMIKRDIHKLYTWIVTSARIRVYYLSGRPNVFRQPCYKQYLRPPESQLLLTIFLMIFERVLLFHLFTLLKYYFAIFYVIYLFIYQIFSFIKRLYNKYFNYLVLRILFNYSSLNIVLEWATKSMMLNFEVRTTH